jgi:hypothetical protein
MQFLPRMLLALILAGASHPAAGVIIPDPAAEPETMAAARSFVGTLPIRDALASGRIVTGRLARSLAAEAAAARPGTDAEQIAPVIASRLGLRVNRLVPEMWPALEEEIAIAYARNMWRRAMDAGAEFFRSPWGVVFAQRTVDQDPLISEILHRRLFERLSGQGDAMVSEAEEAERLRQRINARRR